MDEKRIKEMVENKEPIKLHLGCGNQNWKGYINIDLNPEISNPDIICDVVSLPMFPDNSVDMIENYHLIEHLGHRRAFRALQEWFRILKPGGKLIIECPNLGAALEQFCKIRTHSGDIAGDYGDGSIYHTIYGGQHDKGSFHLGCFTLGMLMNFLKSVGFLEWKIKREFPLHGIEYGTEWNLRLVCEKE